VNTAQDFKFGEFFCSGFSEGTFIANPTFNMDKENIDPDYVYYDRNKSHNSYYYNQTPGVCTNTKMELKSILRTTDANTTNDNTTNNNITAAVAG
jgi:hypothetical protein